MWTYRRGIGDPDQPAWASRLSATLYGVCSALTLDEFALWLDLKDDYWDKQGRKSIDAVAIFGGLLTMGFLGQDALRDLLGLEQRADTTCSRAEREPPAASAKDGEAGGDRAALATREQPPPR